MQYNKNNYVFLYTNMEVEEDVINDYFYKNKVDNAFYVLDEKGIVSINELKENIENFNEDNFLEIINKHKVSYSVCEILNEMYVSTIGLPSELINYIETFNYLDEMEYLEQLELLVDEFISYCVFRDELLKSCKDKIANIIQDSGYFVESRMSSIIKQVLYNKNFYGLYDIFVNCPTILLHYKESLVD